MMGITSSQKIMSSVNTILLVIILVIIVAGGVWWYSEQQSAPAPAQQGVQVNVGGSAQQPQY